VARICDFNAAETAEFVPLFAIVEPALEAAFGEEPLNLCDQRNWAYRAHTPPCKDGRPNPHMHCHIVRRYSRSVDCGGGRWEDPSFGEQFVWGRVSDWAPLRLALIERIRSRLPLKFVSLAIEDTGK
jgi:diadenosine tetraphosphate (Ap4A) HIT family hydrolase